MVILEQEASAWESGKAVGGQTCQLGLNKRDCPNACKHMINARFTAALKLSQSVTPQLGQINALDTQTVSQPLKTTDSTGQQQREATKHGNTDMVVALLYTAVASMLG